MFVGLVLCAAFAEDFPDDAGTISDIGQLGIAELRRLPPDMLTPELQQVLADTEEPGNLDVPPPS